MGSRLYHIDDRLDGQSLAQALRALVRDRSWNDVKRLIANRHVQVHGNLCLDPGRRLRTGDVVKVFDEPLNKPPEASDIPIVYRDAHLVVVEKPAGVTTQREPREQSSGRSQRQATLDELIQQAIDSLRPVRVSEPVNEPKSSSDFILKRRADRATPQRPARPIVRPVHRLDRDTSGLMLFALSPAAETKLVELFKRHEVERKYRAVVVGALREPLRIESMIARDRGDGIRGSTDDATAPERQRAVTHVRPIEAIGESFTVVECELETGRTHQIRIHLAEAGHPLCGEKTYLRPAVGEPPIRDRSGAPRQALHSATLSLRHPIGDERLRFESDWPADLGRWLAALR